MFVCYVLLKNCTVLFSFQDVKAILFVAALSGYDQTLFEVENRNRLLEVILMILLNEMHPNFV